MELRYPTNSLYADYLRALAGIVFFGGWFVFSADSPVWATILGLLLLVFISYGIRTFLYQVTTIRVLPDAVEFDGPFGRRISLDNINRVDLRYYSTRRDRSGRRRNDGWMQMKICDSRGCMQIESTLTSFDALAAKIATAAFRNNAEMSETTLENLTTMGITVTFPEEPAE